MNEIEKILKDNMEDYESVKRQDVYKRQCDYLIVGVNTDELVESYKNKRPIVPLEERAEIVRSIKYVDEVIITNTLDKKEIWDKIRFDEIYIGDDWKGNERWERTGKETVSYTHLDVYKRQIFTCMVPCLDIPRNLLTANMMRL